MECLAVGARFAAKGQDVDQTPGPPDAWDDPIEVKQQFVAAEGGQVVIKSSAGLQEFKTSIATYDSAETSRPADRQRVTTSTDEPKENPVKPEIIKQIRELHGISAEVLPDDASDEQIQTALASVKKPEEKKDDAPAPTPTSTAKPDDDAPTVEVSRDVLTGMQQQIADLEADKKKREETAASERIQTKASEGLRKGKFSKKERDEFWIPLLEVDYEKTAARIDALPENKIPVEQTSKKTGEPNTSKRARTTGLLPELKRERETEEV